MRKILRSAAAFTLILAAAMTLWACVSQDKAQSADALSAASGSGWAVELKGMRTDRLWQSWFEEARKHASHYVQKTVDKKGVKVAYKGMPLWLAIAMVDGPDGEHAYEFDRELWAQGYDVTLVASDGYSATFNTKDLAPDALIIADLEDGLPVKPMIVGDSPKNLWVKDLVRIETSLAPSALAQAASAFSLEIDINSAQASFSLAQLEKLPYYMEARGAYTTSAGTRYEGLYGGVRLLDLIKAYAPLGAEDSVTFIAMDGYEMTYPGSLVLDNKDGDWLLAFTLDGDWLPKDPGYIRTVKVGPSVPNIEGHLSVRMVKKIVIKQKDYVDFSLSLKGKMDSVIDRSTVQSCVSCHSRTVTFERKGVVAEYTGFPFWLLLAYLDDPAYAPHRQDTSILSYDEKAAIAGYPVTVKAADGYSITLSSKDINRRDDLIVAMYKGGEKLPAEEAPLVLVWDQSATGLPETLKNVKMISSVEAGF